MSGLKLRPELQTRHMRATAIELSNSDNTGWTQRKDATELLEITYPIPVGLDRDGNRSKPIERLADFLGDLTTASSSVVTATERAELVSTKLPEMLRRDLAHRGLLSESVTLAWRLLGWVELGS